jgi:hypothetical protein
MPICREIHDLVITNCTSLTHSGALMSLLGSSSFSDRQCQYGGGVARTLLFSKASRSLPNLCCRTLCVCLCVHFMCAVRVL